MKWLLFALVSHTVTPVNSTEYHSYLACNEVAQRVTVKSKRVSCFTSHVKFKKRGVK